MFSGFPFLVYGILSVFSGLVWHGMATTTTGVFKTGLGIVSGLDWLVGVLGRALLTCLGSALTDLCLCG